MDEPKKNIFRRFWNFLKEDSWPSFIVSLVLAFVIIKFIFFPLLSFATGTQLPLVIVESCSMYHSGNFQQIFDRQAVCPNGQSCSETELYGQFNISLNDTQNWGFKNGINKGDIIFVVSPKKLKVGDVAIFLAGTTNPIIHRVISIDPTKITTKGDNNLGLLDVEQNVNRDNVLGKAAFRIPYLGWFKLIFFDYSKPQNERGLCS
jgi:signal peptidase I